MPKVLQKAESLAVLASEAVVGVLSRLPSQVAVDTRNLQSSNRFHCAEHVDPVSDTVRISAVLNSARLCAPPVSVRNPHKCAVASLLISSAMHLC